MSDPWLHAAAIASATLVSEDATCLTVGLLILDGRLPPGLGIAACVLGIYAGDLGLWLLGRVGGRRLLSSRWLGRRIDPASLERLGATFESRAPRLILASRFVPGSRLPLYVAAGILGRSGAVFATWTLLSVLIWVPLLVLVTAALGEAVVGPLRTWFGAGWALLAGASLLAAIAAGAGRLGRTIERPPFLGAQCVAAVARLWRWEFWPMWAFYPPVATWVGWLALRHGGLSTLAAANPGMPEGGFVGESKFDILATLPADCTLAAVRLDPGSVASRASRLAESMARNGWTWPVILKPDAGQRGAGVRLVADTAGARKYFEAVQGPVVAQVYHPGPFEAGIFYVRFPHEARGRIFSITDKRFPSVVGDGVATLETLVWKHTRYRMQAARFLARLGTRRHAVPAVGERVRLAVAGNHAQGTEFRDGSHLVTPELEARIDTIARSVPGFFIGRFDVRYADPARFKAGGDIAIVELNGATSESTNVYDPSRSLLSAYRILFQQWSLVFRIGAANRRLGHVPVSTRRLLDLAWRHLQDDAPLPTSD